MYTDEFNDVDGYGRSRDPDADLYNSFKPNDQHGGGSGNHPFWNPDEPNSPDGDPSPWNHGGGRGFGHIIGEFGGVADKEGDVGGKKEGKGNTDPGDQTGSYTIVFKNGKKYHGKGSLARAKESAKRVGAKNGPTAEEIDWEPAENDRKAFKDEDSRMETDQEGHKNEGNYNQRASPGKKYKLQDAASQLATKAAQVDTGISVGEVVLDVLEFAL
jgi:hypothetical protein